MSWAVHALKSNPIVNAAPTTTCSLTVAWCARCQAIWRGSARTRSLALSNSAGGVYSWDQCVLPMRLKHFAPPLCHADGSVCMDDGNRVCLHWYVHAPLVPTLMSHAFISARMCKGWKAVRALFVLFSSVRIVRGHCEWVTGGCHTAVC